MTAKSQDHAGTWISLMDYSMKRGISLSTLRRYIKAKKLEFKVEKGKYLLWDGELAMNQPSIHPDVNPLQSALEKAQEEIAELKMLIALYEENIPSQKSNS